jgi:hypothetical protein
MKLISPLQEYEPQDISGLVTTNHLGALYQEKPTETSKLVTMMYRTNVGMNFGMILKKFDPLYLQTDADFRWNLQGDSNKNIPLISALINGSPISATSKTGIAGARFQLVFNERYFSDTNIIVGEKNQVYPIRVVGIPEPYGAGNWLHNCELLTGDQTLYIPYAELTAGKRFSKEWSLVSKTLSVKGGTPNYTSPFAMRNVFSMIRMEDTRPGNMISRPVAFSWPVVDENGKQKLMSTWTQYADWELEKQFQDMKDKLLNFATLNRTDNGEFLQREASGFELEQGAGLEQQIESSNISYYNGYELDIKWLTEHIMDLTDSEKGYGETRRILMRTGKWGAYNWHLAIKDYSSLYTPLATGDMIYKTGDGFGFKDNFLEYRGPDGSIISVLVDPAYDDRARNKIKHPSNKGVAKSYEYQILNVGKVGGEDNIRPVYQTGADDIFGMEPGLRDPFQPNMPKRFMSTGKDGYTIHRGFVGGIMVKDPTRCATIRPNVLAP